MGRGLSQRRRVNNFNKAQQAKSGILPLPPAPEEAERLNNKNKKKRNRSVGDQGTASFRRMMRIKAFAEGKQNPRSSGRGAEGKPGTKAEILNQRLTSDGPISSLMPAAAEQELTQPVTDAHTGEVEINAAGGGLEEANTPGKGKTEQPELFAKKAMKPKKKEFLQKRKQRKKAGAQSSGNLATASDDSGSDLEEAIMTDRNKPSFGEQAQQPLKVNLKRKHWSGNSAVEKSDRLQKIFRKQMQIAKVEAQEKEAQRQDLAEAFRKQKRKNQGTTLGGATAESLAALVKRNAAKSE